MAIEIEDEAQQEESEVECDRQTDRSKVVQQYSDAEIPRHR
jgi:hypothetical protein